MARREWYLRNPGRDGEIARVVLGVDVGLVLRVNVSRCHGQRRSQDPVEGDAGQCGASRVEIGRTLGQIKARHVQNLRVAQQVDELDLWRGDAKSGLAEIAHVLIVDEPAQRSRLVGFVMRPYHATLHEAPGGDEAIVEFDARRRNRGERTDGGWLYPLLPS
jgi:hypothetical protein